MNDLAMMSAVYLQERAAQCRRLALQAHSRGIAAELERLAYDYDQDADRVEAFDPERRKASFQ